MKSSENQKLKEWYLTNFSAFENKLNGQSENYLHQIRKDAAEKLSELEFPTKKEEDWKYTNISPILKHNFIPAINTEPEEITSEQVEKNLFTDFDYHLMVFVNGIFSEKLSSIDELPKGVTVGNLAEVMKNDPDSIKNYISKFSKIDNAFNALNTAYAYDGAVVIIPEGKVLEKPIQILYLNGNSKESVLSVPRNLIVAGKNSQVSIVNNYAGIPGKNYFTNVITEIFVDESAFVDYYKIQQENEDAYHIEKADVHQNKQSVFNHYNISFGGSLVRNDVNTKMDDEKIETHYYGLYLAKKKQHVDNHTFVDHANPNCMSNELYKGILDDKAHGVFNGKIIVRPDAQKTNAYQNNKTVLLSETAKIDTKPQLEIFADDVKCSHGATVGNLDKTAYFYIRSRGIPDEIAKSMLIRAFANDVLNVVKIDALKKQLNHLVFEKLHRVEV